MVHGQNNYVHFVRRAPFRQGLRGPQPRLNKGPPGPGSDIQNSSRTRKTLKMSLLPAPERGPINVMSLQAPKDLKGPCNDWPLTRIIPPICFT
jgi:hypothetical protein